MRAYPFRREPAIRGPFAVAANEESNPGALICRPSNRPEIVPIASPGVGTTNRSKVPQIAPRRIY
jgi:hypothetical protein